MLDNKLLAELEMVAMRGAENGSTSLSAFLGSSISIIVNGVEMSDIEVIPEKMGSADALTVGLVSRVTGEIEGNAALLFGREDALKLVGLLGGTNDKEGMAGFGALERSMLEETANIAISSFMNSMTSHLDRKCIPNAPLYLLDLAGAILSVVVMESAEVADRAIMFSTQFLCKQDNMKVLFVFLPSPKSLQALEEGLLDED